MLSSMLQAACCARLQHLDVGGRRVARTRARIAVSVARIGKRFWLNHDLHPLWMPQGIMRPPKRKQQPPKRKQQDQGQEQKVSREGAVLNACPGRKP